MSKPTDLVQGTRCRRVLKDNGDGALPPWHQRGLRAHDAEGQVTLTGSGEGPLRPARPRPARGAGTPDRGQLQGEDPPRTGLSCPPPGAPARPAQPPSTRSPMPGPRSA